MEIQSLQEVHWPAVKAIYEEGIATGHATFQTSAPDWKDWDQGHLPVARMVAIERGNVAGWAALTPVSGRCVYAGVAEVSVYVAASQRGKGVGKLLLNELVQESERHGLWTLQAGIFPENESSLHIHLAAGFVVVGTRKKIGKMKDVWRDTVLLERRSEKVGIE